MAVLSPTSPRGGAPGRPRGAGEPAPTKENSFGQAAPDSGGPYVTPLVRKMAAEHGVDLSTVEGTGVGGRIRKQDVLDAAAKARSRPRPKPAEPAAAAGRAAAQAPAAGAPPSPLRGKTEPMTRLRKVIAKRMVESLQVSAQLTTVVEVDVTNIARLRDAVKAEFAAREGVKLSFLPFFAKAAVDALKAHPSLNASIDTEKGEVTYYDHENLSVAVDTEKGLLTPVIKDAGDLSIAGLARKIADVADRTRNNKIGPDELAGGTFTLTNTGSRGALFDTPIINQPQVAILGTGAVVKRAVVIDDPNLGETIAVRRMVYLALTYDHRIVDGADAGASSPRRCPGWPTCGWLMIGVSNSAPRLPVLVSVNVPPARSSGLTLFVRVRAARSAILRARPRDPQVTGVRITGTSSPRSVSTAMPRCSASW